MIQTHRAAEAEEKITVQPQSESDSLVYFQYQGVKGLTVIGPTSRKHYRFNRPGEIVVVDPRDRRALAGVSVLRQVSKATEFAKEL